MKHLVVADGRLQEGVPIDQPLAAKNLAVGEHAEKSVTDRPGTGFIEREAEPLPVAATAHLF